MFNISINNNNTNNVIITLLPEKNIKKTNFDNFTFHMFNQINEHIKNYTDEKNKIMYKFELILSDLENFNLNEFIEENNIDVSCIEYLDIVYKGTNFNSNIIEFNKFTNLKSISFEMDCNFVFNFDFNYENNIQIIDFTFCKKFNNPINDLPKNLLKLYFSADSLFNQEINNLPLGLKELYLNSSFTNSLDFLPSSLEILKIYINTITAQPNYLDNLPSKLKKLFVFDFSLYKNDINLDNLPNSIEELSVFVGNSISKIPQKLKKITIGSNYCHIINLLLDSSIEHLKIFIRKSKNEELVFLKEFTFPQSLRIIEIDAFNMSDFLINNFLSGIKNLNEYIIEENKYNHYKLIKKEHQVNL